MLGTSTCGQALGWQRCVQQFACYSQSGFSAKQNKAKPEVVMCVEFENQALGLLPWKPPWFQHQTDAQRKGWCLTFSYGWVILGRGGRATDVGTCSVCVPYMLLLPWWLTWLDLFCCLPVLLILCVLFPLCCTIRTLQWDTDPSVLQLQSDSELGYMSALLLLL